MSSSTHLGLRLEAAVDTVERRGVDGRPAGQEEQVAERTASAITGSLPPMRRAGADRDVLAVGSLDLSRRR